MAIGFFTRDTIISLKGQRYKLVTRFDDDVWQIQNVSTGRLADEKQEDLLESLRLGELHIVVDEKILAKRLKAGVAAERDAVWASLSESEKDVARYRWIYVSEALKNPRSKSFLAEAIAKVAFESEHAKPPSVASVSQWTRHYIVGGRDISSLAAHTRRRGNRTGRYDKAVEEIVDSSLDQIYLQPARPSLEDARLHAVQQITAHNRLLIAGAAKLPLPTLRYCRRRLSVRRPFDVCAARFGLQYALRRFRNVLGFSVGERVLERVEIDHTVINMIVIDERSALPLGRPWLTVALDDNSRSVLGYYLSFEPPSTLSVANCLMHAILPKTYVKTRYPKIQHTWDCYGVMSNLVVDNGLEFHSKALEDAALQFGITLQYCPKAAPWYKGKIERFLGTMNRGVAHGMPGTTFANILEREDYDSQTTATITLDALNEIIHTWIIDYYHQKIHSALRDTPANHWAEGASGAPLPLPIAASDLEVAFAVPEERTLTFKGIELFNMFYNSEECQDLRMRHGEKLDIVARYIPSDIGHVFIQDPQTHRTVRVPVVARFKEYATGLSKWQHGVCRKYAQRRMEGRTDVVALAEAKARIAAIVEAEIFQKGRKLRKGSARHKNAGSAPAVPEQAAATGQATGSLARDLAGHVDDASFSSRPPPSAAPVRFVPRSV